MMTPVRVSKKPGAVHEAAAGGGNIMAIDPALPEWEGPAQLTCSFVSAHTHTVLYRWCQDPDLTGFYAPRALLPVGADETPEQMVTVLARSSRPLYTFGFGRERITPRVTPDFWEVDFSDECAKVIRYEVWYSGQTYKIYVPKAVFGGHRHPERIVVQMVVPGNLAQ